MSVAIITDSTSDLDAAVAAHYEIGIVPLFVNFGEARFRDGVDLSHAEFYRKLASLSELPTTSQPTSAAFEDAFRPLVAAGRPIVCITITASLSGTINAAQAAAAQFPGAEIHLVDSETVTGGAALQAIHAAELAASGADTATILAALTRDRAGLHGYAALPDLSHAVRTGRVSRAQAFIGSALRIVPVLRIDHGKVGEGSRVRTFARAQETMVEATLGNIGSGEGARIAILHANAPDLAEKLRARVAAGITGTPAYFAVVEAGPAIATHAGAGAVGMFSIPG
jgi:DegV family protein with EDD domain